MPGNPMRDAIMARFGSIERRHEARLGTLGPVLEALNEPNPMLEMPYIVGDIGCLTDANEASWPLDRIVDLGAGVTICGCRYFSKNADGGWLGGQSANGPWDYSPMAPTRENLQRGMSQAARLERRPGTRISEEFVNDLVNRCYAPRASGAEIQAHAMNNARNDGHPSWEHMLIPYHEWLAMTNDNRREVGTFRTDEHWDTGQVISDWRSQVLESRVDISTEENMPRRSGRCRSCGRVVGRSNGCHCRGTEGSTNAPPLTLAGGGVGMAVRNITGEGLRTVGSWQDRELLIRSEIGAAIAELRSLHEMEDVGPTDELEITIKVRRNPSD